MMDDNITLYGSSVPQMYDAEVAGIAVARTLKSTLHTAKQNHLPAKTLFFVERSAIFPILLITWLVFAAYMMVASAFINKCSSVIRGLINEITGRNGSS